MDVATFESMHQACVAGLHFVLVGLAGLPLTGVAFYSTFQVP